MELPPWPVFQFQQGDQIHTSDWYVFGHSVYDASRLTIETVQRFYKLICSIKSIDLYDKLQKSLVNLMNLKKWHESENSVNY